MARRLLDQATFNRKLVETLDQTVSNEIAKLSRRLRLLTAVKRGDVTLRELTIRRKVMTWTVTIATPEEIMTAIRTRVELLENGNDILRARIKLLEAELEKRPCQPDAVERS